MCKSYIGCSVVMISQCHALATDLHVCNSSYETVSNSFPTALVHVIVVDMYQPPNTHTHAHAHAHTHAHRHMHTHTHAHTHTHTHTHTRTHTHTHTYTHTHTHTHTLTCTHTHTHTHTCTHILDCPSYTNGSTY